MSDTPPPLPDIGSLNWGPDLNDYLTWLTERPPPMGNISTYQFSFNPGGPPPVGSQVRLDTVDQTLATHVYVRYVTSDGLDLRNLMAQIGDTSRIYLQDKDTSAAWRAYHVLAAGTDTGDHFDFPVAYAGGGLDVPAQAILVAFTPASQALPG